MLLTAPAGGCHCSLTAFEDPLAAQVLERASALISTNAYVAARIEYTVRNQSGTAVKPAVLLFGPGNRIRFEVDGALAFYDGSDLGRFIPGTGEWWTMAGRGCDVDLPFLAAAVVEGQFPTLLDIVRVLGSRWWREELYGGRPVLEMREPEVLNGRQCYVVALDQQQMADRFLFWIEKDSYRFVKYRAIRKEASFPGIVEGHYKSLWFPRKIEDREFRKGPVVSGISATTGYGSNSMNRLAGVACLRGPALLLLTQGCLEASTTGPVVRQHLIEAMQPIRCAPFVEMTGTIESPSTDNAQPFILLMGTRGRYLYRCGDMAWFSDGTAEGSIDFGTFPPAEYFTTANVKPENIAMAVGMGGGPYPFALARAATGGQWLSSLEVQLRATVRYTETVSQNHTTIAVSGTHQEHRFVFGGRELVPLSYALRSLSGTDAPHVIEFTSVRYPQVLPDVAFQPYVGEVPGQRGACSTRPSR